MLINIAALLAVTSPLLANAQATVTGNTVSIFGWNFNTATTDGAVQLIGLIVGFLLAIFIIMTFIYFGIKRCMSRPEPDTSGRSVRSGRTAKSGKSGKTVRTNGTGLAMIPPAAGGSKANLSAASVSRSTNALNSPSPSARPIMNFGGDNSFQQPQSPNDQQWQPQTPVAQNAPPPPPTVPSKYKNPAQDSGRPTQDDADQDKNSPNQMQQQQLPQQQQPGQFQPQQPQLQQAQFQQQQPGLYQPLQTPQGQYPQQQGQFQQGQFQPPPQQFQQQNQFQAQQPLTQGSMRAPPGAPQERQSVAMAFAPPVANRSVNDLTQQSQFPKTTSNSFRPSPMNMNSGAAPSPLSSRNPQLGSQPLTQSQTLHRGAKPPPQQQYAQEESGTVIEDAQFVRYNQSGALSNLNPHSNPGTSQFMRPQQQQLPGSSPFAQPNAIYGTIIDDAMFVDNPANNTGGPNITPQVETPVIDSRSRTVQIVHSSTGSSNMPSNIATPITTASGKNIQAALGKSIPPPPVPRPPLGY